MSLYLRQGKGIPWQSSGQNTNKHKQTKPKSKQTKNKVTLSRDFMIENYSILFFFFFKREKVYCKREKEEGEALLQEFTEENKFWEN